MTVPYTFGTATTSIPLSNLDSNFNTPITLGNTSIYLGNTTTTIGNLTLTNVTISSGTANITSNITYATANAVVFTNSSSIGTTGANLTFDGTTFTASSIKNSALTSGRVTFAGASGLLSDSANLVFDGTNVGIGTNSPSAKLDITSASAGFSNIKLVQTGVRTWAIENTGTSGLFKIIEAGVADRLVINSSGNVGIGTSSPSRQLQSTINVATAYSSSDFDTASNQLYLTNTNTTTNAFTGIQMDVGSNSQAAISAVRVGDGEVAMTFGTRVAGSRAERMRIDSSGNLGLGVTPSAWRTTDRALEIGSVGKGLSAPTSGNSVFLATNWYVNTAPANVYAANGYASRYAQSDGTHIWSTAPSNSSGAGAALTFAEGMRLDASGNLGVGETSPSTFGKLVVKSGTINLVTDTPTQRRLSFWSTSNGNSENAYIQVQNDGSTTNTGEILFATRNSSGTLAERMRIDASGYVIVSGTSTNSDNATYQGGGEFVSRRASSASTLHAAFINGGSQVGSITSSTIATLYNTTSDQRLKTNVVVAPSGNIDNIKVRSFDWIADGSHQEYGMVAQELLKVAPYAVHQPKNSDEMMSVDYSKLVPMMIKEIQDLKQRIATLENK